MSVVGEGREMRIEKLMECVGKEIRCKERNEM